jgi:hypothetical protein
MSQKDKRPDASGFFDGKTSIQGAVTTYCGEDNTIVSPKRHYQNGNKCGHFPLQPRLYSSQVKRPLPIYRAIQNANEYYWRPNNYLQDLQDIRKKRSERREGIAAVIQVILDYTDLATLTVGIPTKKEIQYLTLRFIAKKARVNLRRTYRVISCLVKAGYLTIERRCERVGEGLYKGLAAIRKVSAKLFVHLGVEYSILSLTQGWLRKRAEIKNYPGKFTGKLKRLGGFINKQAKVVTKKFTSNAQHADALKARAERMRELFENGLSPDEIRKQLGPPS